MDDLTIEQNRTFIPLTKAFRFEVTGAIVCQEIHFKDKRRHKFTSAIKEGSKASLEEVQEIKQHNHEGLVVAHIGQHCNVGDDDRCWHCDRQGVYG